MTDIHRSVKKSIQKQMPEHKDKPYYGWFLDFCMLKIRYFRLFKKSERQRKQLDLLERSRKDLRKELKKLKEK